MMKVTVLCGHPTDLNEFGRYYSTEAPLQSTLASPEGQATVADIGKFATGGATVLTGVTQG